MTLELLILCSIRFSHFLELSILLPLGNSIMSQLHLNEVQYGKFIASYPLGAFLINLIGGPFFERFSKKQALLTCFGCFGMSTLLSGMVHHFYLLLIIRFFTGIFGGAISSLCYSYISENITEKKQSEAMGYLMASVSLAILSGAPIGLWIMNRFKTWNSPLLILGLLSIILFLSALFILKNKENKFVSTLPFQLTDLTNPFKLILSKPKYFSPILILFILAIGQYSFTPFISLIIESRFQLPHENVTRTFMLMGTLSILGSPFIGKFTDKIGKKKSIFIFLTFSLFISTLFIRSEWIQFFLPHYSKLVIILMSILGASFVWRMIPLLSSLSDVPPAESRVSYLMANNTTQQLASSCGISIGGLLLAHSLNLLFCFLAFTSFLSLILTYSLNNRKNQYG